MREFARRLPTYEEDEITDVIIIAPPPQPGQGPTSDGVPEFIEVPFQVRYVR